MKDTKLLLEYTKNINVLYVEDDISLLTSTKELFANYFKSVDTAIDGKDGLEKYISYKQKHDSFYDLVITDINMPNLNGLNMSEAILSKNSMQAIIITTAHNENDFLTHAIDLGISGFVTKPIYPEKLAKVLYKTSQAISDHQFVESHVEMMENLNMQLEAQNKELLLKNTELEKSFRILDTMVHKEQMTHPKKESQSTNKNYCSIEEKHINDQIQELVSNDLYELQDILVEIDVNIIDIINNTNHISTAATSELVELFSKYASVLNFYSFFSELNKAMSNFSLTIKNHPLPENEDSVKNIFMLLESFVYVLGKWHNDIASGDDSKINQFDDSIISDIYTIINIWTQKEEAVCENDLNGIFDF